MHSSTVKEFYENSTLLITGGTGFLGKVLLEKLLRCFEIKKVYLIIRSKDDMNANQRLKEMLKEPVFKL